MHNVYIYESRPTIRIDMHTYLEYLLMKILFVMTDKRMQCTAYVYVVYCNESIIHNDWYITMAYQVPGSFHILATYL